MITAHFAYIASNRFTHATRTLACLCAVVLFMIMGQHHTNVVAAGFTPAAPFASVQGQVWKDVNHDGIHQAQEPGMAGITVTLYFTGSVEVTHTVTGASGHYTFTQLQPATYTVGFQALTNYSFTLFGLGPNATDNVAHADGRTDPIVLESGNPSAQIDAGLWQSALVSDESATAEKRPIFLPFIASTK